ncbi:MAG: sodium:proton antiporter [Clostridiales Family XIII bacterium]|jgi:CPA1 family monovalent cation:H+ antiporter|nr:sodium:proton antiporter [Clostridiales Family XIII bacterium]
MEATTLLIVLIATIVLSNVLESIFPQLPLPLIQILLGAVLSLSPLETAVTINPEIFMGLLIAPLLFRESEEADIYALWKVRKEVIFMVFALVFLTVFSIGFSVRLFVPTMPLAACFALGAILGPTDAVAVSSMSSRIKIDDRIMSVLKGEWLINDASGVISFKFAVLALTTGSFSLASASLKFVILCVGGFIFGFLISVAKDMIVQKLKKMNIRNTATYMLLDILTPFLCYFIAEKIGVSGIIAAVTAGCRQSLHLHKVEAFEADLAVFKKSTWEMITSVLNATVFILLGLELPRIIGSVMHCQDFTVPFAFGIGAFATVVLFAVRFMATLIAANKVAGKDLEDRMKNCAIMTLSGVKGTVSLATAFALPLYVPNVFPAEQRDLILLITGAVILYSLVIASIALPLLAKSKVVVDEEKDEDIHIQILKDVIPELEKSEATCVSSIVINIKKRIREIEREQLTNKELRKFKEVRENFFRIEIELLKKHHASGDLTDDEFRMYSRFITVIMNMHSMGIFKKIKYQIKFFGGNGANSTLSRDLHDLRENPVEEGRLQAIFWENTGGIIEEYNKRSGGDDEKYVVRLVEERIDDVGSLMERAFGGALKAEINTEYDRELIHSFEVEREVLDRYLEEGKLEAEEADEIRIKINTLENYALSDAHNDAVKKTLVNVVNKRRKKAREVSKGRRR